LRESWQTKNLYEHPEEQAVLGKLENGSQNNIA